MNKFEKEQIDIIVRTHWENIAGVQNDVFKESRSIHAEMMEYGGLFKATNLKSDSLLNKALKIYNFEDTDFQNYCNDLFSFISFAQKMVLMAEYFFNRQIGQANKKVLKNWQIAEKLNLNPNQYKMQKMRARSKLLKLDKHFRNNIY